MKGVKGIIFILAFSIALNVVSAVTYINLNATNPIYECGLIGQTGNYYLTNDISANSSVSTCISMGASGIVLNGNGYTITSENVSTYGIYAKTRSNLTITNLTVGNYTTGISLKNVQRSALFDITVIDSADTGILLEGVSSNNTFYRITTKDNIQGIYIGGTGLYDNKFYNCNFDDKLLSVIVDASMGGGTKVRNARFVDSDYNISKEVSAGDTELIREFNAKFKVNSSTEQGISGAEIRIVSSNGTEYYHNFTNSIGETRRIFLRAYENLNGTRNYENYTVYISASGYQDYTENFTLSSTQTKLFVMQEVVTPVQNEPVTASGGGGGGSCYSDWICNQWGTCSDEGTQTRTCSLVNPNCVQASSKPTESQTCVAENRNETILLNQPEIQTTEETTTPTTRAGITGAAIGAIGKPSFYIPAIFVIAILCALAALWIRNKRKAKIVAESNPKRKSVKKKKN